MFSRFGSVNQTVNKSKDSEINSHDFFEAIKTGDIEKCKKIISETDIRIWELTDEKNNTVLHHSVFQNNYDLTLLVLEEAKKGIWNKFIKEDAKLYKFKKQRRNNILALFSNQRQYKNF